MERMIENLILGNLKDAKKAAKRFSVGSIRAYLVEVYGWSNAKSAWAALYLKGNAMGWQRYCDEK